MGNFCCFFIHFVELLGLYNKEESCWFLFFYAVFLVGTQFLVERGASTVFFSFLSVVYLGRDDFFFFRLKKQQHLIKENQKTKLN